MARKKSPGWRWCSDWPDARCLSTTNTGGANVPTKHRREADKMKMAGWTWFPFDVVDWLTSSDVMAMTFAERGMYVTLLCVQWRDGFVSSEPYLSAKQAGCRPEV